MRVSEKDHRGLYTFFFVEFKPSPVASFSHLRWPANRHTELCLRRHARYLRQPGARVIDEICTPAFATPNACHHPPTPTQSTDGTCCPLQMRRGGARWLLRPSSIIRPRFATDGPNFQRAAAVQK